MPIKNEIYRCKTQQEAVAWMEQQAGRKMYPCIYPSRMRHDYYISTDGVMFASKYYHVQKIYLCYRINAVKSAFLRNNDWIYTLASSNMIEDVLMQRLVYCTFELGYWDTNITVLFKDGNHDNCNIENLTVRDNTITALTSKHAELMQRFVPDYKSRFKKMSCYLQHLNGLTKDEANDCVEDAFMRVIAKSDDMNLDHFVGYWWVMARKMSMAYVNRRVARIDLEDYMTYNGCKDTDFGLNLLNVIIDENQRNILDLTAEGYSLTQIVDITGITKKRVWTMQKKAKKILRNYLRTDKEIMKIYAKDTP